MKEELDSALIVAGYYTLLFTDMEGSSDYARSLGKSFAPVHNRHHEIIDSFAEKRGGHVRQIQGDSFFVFFRDAHDATMFAVEAMRALEETNWTELCREVPRLRVRIGMHTGYLEKAPERIADRDFIGHVANLTHRVMEAAHGGQILCSEATHRAILERTGKPADTTFETKGHFRLKGVGATELVQITAEGLQAKFSPPTRARRFGDPHPDDFPQAEQEYRTRVRNSLDKMELFGADLDKEETYPLETAYISLRFQDSPIDVETFFDGLEPGGALVHIEGDAGSGKSTLLKWLAVRAASREGADFQRWRERFFRCNRSVDLDTGMREFKSADEAEIERFEQLWRFRLPFFIRLRDLVNSNTKLTPLPKLLSEMSGIDQTLIIEKLKEGKCLLLIDGADEVPTGMRQDRWSEIKTVIQNYGEKNLVVVSSRPMPDELEWLESFGAKRCKVADLTDPDKLALIERWHSAIAKKFENSRNKYHGMDAKGLKERGAALMRELPQNEAAHELAKVPLLCALICALYASRESRPQLPKTLPELCERACSMLLEARHKASNVAIPEFGKIYKELDYAHKRRIVQNLAVSMLDRGVSELSFRNAAGIVRDELGEDLCPKESDSEKFINSFVVLSGVLRFGSGDSVEFLHNTLKEHLAAERYLRTKTDDRLLYHPGSRNVSNLLLFVGGDPDESNRLLALLMKSTNYTPKQLRAAKLMFLRCYPLYSGRTPELRLIWDNLKSEFVPPKDEDEAIAVAAYGDSIVPKLKYKPGRSGTRAAACIQALRRIDTAASSKALEEYCEKETRHLALDALTQFLNPLKVAWVRYGIVDAELDSDHIEGYEKEYRRRIIQDHLLEFLSGFPAKSIKSLILSYTQVSKIEGLENATHLQTLYLSNTNVNKIEGLENATQLQTLHLANTQVSKIEGLENATQLQWLSLENTQVSKIEGLENATQLQELYLSDTQVSKIEGLESATQLQELNLEGTQVIEKEKDAFAKRTGCTVF